MHIDLKKFCLIITVLKKKSDQLEVYKKLCQKLMKNPYSVFKTPLAINFQIKLLFFN